MWSFFIFAVSCCTVYHSVIIKGLIGNEMIGQRAIGEDEVIFHFCCFVLYRVPLCYYGIIYPTRIDEQIRYHINGSYLKEFLKAKHSWSEHTWDTIDFKAFGRFFKSVSGSKQIQYMKFVHDLQPLGVHQEKVHRSSGTVNELTMQCPCCRAASETQLHMLQCTSNPARQKALIALRKASHKGDGTDFLKVFGDIFEQWLVHPEHIPCLANRLNPFLRQDQFPDDYSRLIQLALAEQQVIGWINMCRGFLSTKWYHLASSHICPDDSTKIEHRNDGANRVHLLALKTVHSLTMALWTGRNEALHGCALEDEQRRLTVVDMEIQKYHSESDLILTDDKFYCETSLEKLLRSSSANKRRWLLRVKASRNRKAAMQSLQPKITKFFPCQQEKNRKMQAVASMNDTIPSKRNRTTQQLMTQYLMERAPNRQVSARNKTTQQLLTTFLQERAPNLDPTNNEAPQSPPPSMIDIG